jgi:ankyrin repeat protein
MNQKTIQEILRKGNLQEIKQQIKNSIKFKNDRTPLHYAAGNENKEVIPYLIDELNYDPFYMPEDKITPLHRAAHYGNLQAIHLFLKYGIDPEIIDEYGFNVITTLDRNQYFDLVPLAEKMIAASKTDFSACFELAQLYFSGENPALKKDLDNANYYIEKALSIENVTLQKRLQAEDLLRKIKQAQRENVTLENTPSSLPDSDKEDKPQSVLSLGKSLTDLLGRITNSLPPLPHENATESEKQSLLTKKNQ